MHFELQISPLILRCFFHFAYGVFLIFESFKFQCDHIYQQFPLWFVLFVSYFLKILSLLSPVLVFGGCFVSFP